MPFHLKRRAAVLTPSTRLNDAVKNISYLVNVKYNVNLCVPMEWARKHNEKFDVIIIYTNYQTVSGGFSAHEAFMKYRKASGIVDTKLVVVALSASGLTITDPSDKETIDVIGFDINTPEIINRFILGKL
ncbi:unnamed protein product [Soboliphyme baturini]|uniref:PK_C domain-containing protein n=1 Tax=Soboliphyme baturini TaxID=241478 RepID=A0A183J4K4_9BILA|nr:unnamed protein product [Soboliphyme baturini]